jgi:UDP-glucuronate 4-epimerase
LTILVTGVTGFIGFHVAAHLLERGEQVIGIDNVNDYYDTSLKEARLLELKSSPYAESFEFIKLDIADDAAMEIFFKDQQFDRIVHLAAQAGVRYSIENPHAYVESNIRGFMNILTGALAKKVKHLVYASSSSVYGNSKKIPFSTDDPVDNPVSMYAATKKSNELMAHVYSHLYQMPTTGLRFFTVYGPWGRPDMSPFIFADAIFNETPIKLFNYGKHQRDFTYIDDIVQGVVSVLDSPPSVVEDVAPYQVYNIGNNSPVELLDYVETLERHIGKKAITELAPLQPGDVVTTYADVEDLEKDIGYRPSTSIDEGVGKFIDWYRDYYRHQ